MGVSMPTGGGGGRKKSLDAELNLVPFIDLLSMCICFLLITAVWIEVGSMQVKQSHGTEGAAQAKSDLELDVKMTGPGAVQIAVKKGGKSIRSITVKESAPDQFVSKLDTQLKQVTGMGPVTAAMVSPAKGTSYGDLVQVMDVLRRNKISNLGVVPVRDAT